MKFFRITVICSVILLTFFSCQNEEKNIWDIKIDQPSKPIEVVDISKDYFDSSVSTEDFKTKFPWFQGSVSDEDFIKRRTDSAELKIYKEAASKIDLKKLEKDLSELFPRIKHYFTNFQTPKVFTFSSGLQMIQEPIIYDPRQNYLFVDISGFMGENNLNYKSVEKYFQKSMNPQNILPKISETIAFTLVPYDRNNQKFIDELVYRGKILTLQDAFLPHVPDYLKMNYDQEQYQWTASNEENIWNYFVENDLIFSADPKLVERFISPAPFSKFYTEIDNQSSPQVGVFTGWQICRKYFQKNPETQLQEFLEKNVTDIFNQSGYKPKN